MLNKKSNILLEIQAVIECEICQGTGIIVRQPGVLVFDESVISKCSNKGDNIKIENIKEILEQIPAEIPGFTDREHQLQCQCCHGIGKIKKNISLTELKKLLQE